MSTTLDSRYLLEATAAQLQKGLSSGIFNSTQLVEACLSQIERHNDYLRAVVQPRPSRSLLAQEAGRLDDERAAGKIRGPLHGIPIILKDNISTLPSLGMDTTAGSMALKGSKPAANSKVAQRLLDGGAIIIAKANMSEFAWYKTVDAPSGWSPVGGQTQSAYVRGGYQATDSVAGDSNPAGSSSGSAVSVSAGYAPLSLGTETNGSLIQPASRAALYSLKPTIGLVPGDGIVPICRLCDSAGPMSKSAVDLAVLLDVLLADSPKSMTTGQGRYEQVAHGKWDGLRIGTLNPASWLTNPRTRTEESIKQMTSEMDTAFEKVQELAETFEGNVNLISAEEFSQGGKKHLLARVFDATFRAELEEYLAKLDSSQVRTLKDIIQFNVDNADVELPKEYPKQDLLEGAQDNAATEEQFALLVDEMRRIGRSDGLDKTFRENNINVLLGPVESEMSSFAAAAGYPVASLPLGYLDYNGRPFGIAAIAQANQDELLVQLMSAWESSFPPRQPPPPMIVKGGELPSN